MSDMSRWKHKLLENLNLTSVLIPKESRPAGITRDNCTNCWDVKKWDLSAPRSKTLSILSPCSHILSWKFRSEMPEHFAYQVVNINSVGKEQEMLLKNITAVKQQQRAPATRTSDCFKVQSQGTQHSPHNPTGPSGGYSNSPEFSFASQQGCFTSGVSASLAAQLWAVLQFHSSLMILVLTRPCVILTYAMIIPTPSLCSEPLTILPSLLQVPCPRWKGSHHRYLSLAAPHPVVLSPGMCLPHDYPSRNSSTPSHPPQGPPPGIRQVMATVTLLS